MLTKLLSHSVTHLCVPLLRKPPRQSQRCEPSGRSVALNIVQSLVQPEPRGFRNAAGPQPHVFDPSGYSVILIYPQFGMHICRNSYRNYSPQSITHCGLVLVIKLSYFRVVPSLQWHPSPLVTKLRAPSQMQIREPGEARTNPRIL